MIYVIRIPEENDEYKARKTLANRLERDWEMLKKDDTRFREQYGNINMESGEQYSYYSFPVAVVPALTNDRMVIQSSAFTLHGGSLCWETKSAAFPGKIPEFADINGTRRRIYFRIKIPKNNKSDLKKDLFTLGVHQGALFPEMDKQYEYLETMWQVKGNGNGNGKSTK